MEHPFLESAQLQDKTVEELQSTISSLLQKITFASRMGNSSMRYQLQMVLESYQLAYTKKVDEMMSKKKIKDKINIKEG